jgi:D-lactate dehydrogenase
MKKLFTLGLIEAIGWHFDGREQDRHDGLKCRDLLPQIASSIATEVEVPVGDTCCGTAGDRGLLHPELVVSATPDAKVELDVRPADAYISANRTCEMGLLHATGRPYQSFVFLLAELTRPDRHAENGRGSTTTT